MLLTVKGQKYKVHINAPNPFAISKNRIIGITPNAAAKDLPLFKTEWSKLFNKESEDREWVVDLGGRQHIVLKIRNKFLCDCWPFRRAGTCKHIEAVQEECL